MTQEEKQLLLQDLCARLPYGVICDIYNDTCTIKEKLLIGGLSHFCDDTICVRPYLRSMSSMTEGERKEFKDICTSIAKDGTHFVMEGSIDSNHMLEKINWLNAHYFDYRGLIEKGLAIAVTEKNNPYKE